MQAEMQLSTHLDHFANVSVRRKLTIIYICTIVIWFMSCISFSLSMRVRYQRWLNADKIMYANEHSSVMVWLKMEVFKIVLLLSFAAEILAQNKDKICDKCKCGSTEDDRFDIICVFSFDVIDLNSIIWPTTEKAIYASFQGIGLTTVDLWVLNDILLIPRNFDLTAKK